MSTALSAAAASAKFTDAGRPTRERCERVYVYIFVCKFVPSRLYVCVAFVQLSTSAWIFALLFACAHARGTGMLICVYWSCVLIFECLRVCVRVRVVTCAPPPQVRDEVSGQEAHQDEAGRDAGAQREDHAFARQHRGEPGLAAFSGQATGSRAGLTCDILAGLPVHRVHDVRLPHA